MTDTPTTPTGVPRGRQPISVPGYKEPTDEEISSVMEGHEEGQYRDYVLLVNSFYPDAQTARKAIGNPYMMKKLRRVRGDVVSLKDLGEVERLLRGRAISPIGTPEAWRAMVEKSASEGDEDSMLELKLQDARRRRLAIEAEEKELERKRQAAKDAAKDGEA